MFCQKLNFTSSQSWKSLTIKGAKLLLITAATLGASIASASGNGIKNLGIGESTMELLDPNPAGQSQQPAALTFVYCVPRIEEAVANPKNTDEVLGLIREIAYPIVLTKGSQVMLRRPSKYQNADGSTLEPVVLITCGSPL